MKYLLILSFLLIVSCGSMESMNQRGSKTKLLVEPFEVNSYGQIRVNADSNVSCQSLATYKEISADIQKAIGWDKVVKTTDVTKEINTYVKCKMNISYNYKSMEKRSYVSICIHNELYSSISDIHCSIVSDYQKTIEALNTAPEKMKLLVEEIQTMERLR